MTAARNKYVPDLSGYHSLCEYNYVRMLKLLPELEPEGAYFDFHINDALDYRLTIVECCRYTTIISVAQLSANLPDYLIPNMEVRLYHDANMAEVTRSKNISRLKGAYPYPNKQMLQKDEKMQINRFLQEWLKLCTDYGQVSVDLSSY